MVGQQQGDQSECGEHERQEAELCSPGSHLSGSTTLDRQSTWGVHTQFRPEVNP